MLEHNNVIWGSKCECGQDCFILQNKHHPWMDQEFVLTIICPKCGRSILIDKEKASRYYSEKILSYFTNLSGAVIDLGCGGGFLCHYLNGESNINKVYAIDVDESVKASVESIGSKVEFIHSDIKELDHFLNSTDIDYVVHRDAFMFVDSPKDYFDAITKYVKKGIRHMGWYLSNSDRMKNNLLPEDIKKELELRGWKVTLEYLDWYKCGYFIKADK